MSRKHFVLIAETIRGLRFPVAPEVTRRIVAEQFAKALATTNPGFNRDRFFTAAGFKWIAEQEASKAA